jgi:hypothetical protein
MLVVCGVGSVRFVLTSGRMPVTLGVRRMPHYPSVHRVGRSGAGRQLGMLGIARLCRRALRAVVAVLRVLVRVVCVIRSHPSPLHCTPCAHA